MSSTAITSVWRSEECGSSSSGTLGLKKWHSPKRRNDYCCISSLGWTREGGDHFSGQKRIGSVSKGKGKSSLQRALCTLQSGKGGYLQQGTPVGHPWQGDEGEQGKDILLVVEGLGGQKGKIHPKKGVAQWVGADWRRNQNEEGWWYEQCEEAGRRHGGQLLNL